MMIPNDLADQMTANAERQVKAQEDDGAELDFSPVAMFMAPPAAVWLVTEMMSDDSGNPHFFGLCDLGVGSPELGYVSASDLDEVGARLAAGWQPSGTLSEYADAANSARRIVELTPPEHRAD